MPASARTIEPLGGFRWTPATPQVGRRAVSYYGRWPSPSQERAILLRAKELVPIVCFLEACATLHLIQEFREQPGILTRFAAGKSRKYRPDFVFSSSGTSCLIFAHTRPILHAAALDVNVIAYCGEEVCHFRVCEFSAKKASIAALSALSPAQLRRGLLTDAQREIVLATYHELVGVP